MTMALDLSPRDMQAHAREAAQFLRALAHDTRLMILCTLNGQELSVGALQAELDVSQSALSQHLAVLREEGLVATRRQSQTIFYRIAHPAAVAVIAVLAETFCPKEP